MFTSLTALKILYAYPELFTKKLLFVAFCEIARGKSLTTLVFIKFKFACTYAGKSGQICQKSFQKLRFWL
jgi:hypothetical protein